MRRAFKSSKAEAATGKISGKKSEAAAKAVLPIEPTTAAELRSIIGGDSGSGEEDYDMHAQTKAEKMRMKKATRMSKKKSKKADNEDADEKTNAEFVVNTTDERFFPKLRSSANFGIDPTSSEFKPTEGMNKILTEQRRIRQLEQDREEQRRGEGGEEEVSAEGKRKRSNDVAPLVDRLKKKYKNK
jgi:hypothetical protein